MEIKGLVRGELLITVTFCVQLGSSSLFVVVENV